MSRQFSLGWGYNDDLTATGYADNVICPAPPVGVTRLVEVVRFSFVRGAGGFYHWLAIVNSTSGVASIVYSRNFSPGSYVIRGPWVVDSDHFLALTPLIVSDDSGYVIAEWSER